MTLHSRSPRLPGSLGCLFLAILAAGCSSEPAPTAPLDEPGPPTGPPPVQAPAPPLSPELGLVETTIGATIELPPGSGIELEDLEILTAIDERIPVNADGTTSLVVFMGGPQVGIVFGRDGEPVLFGWLDPAAGADAFSARSTAEVFAYFDLGGFLLPPPLRLSLMQAIRRSDLGPLEAAIATELALPPHHLGEAAASLVLVRQQTAQALAGPVSAAAIRAGILIDPTGQHSGITVLQQGFNEVVVRNDYRRRAIAYIDRLDGAPVQVAKLDISPTKGSTSGFQAIAEGTVDFILQQNEVHYGGVSTEPQHLLLVPEDADRTEYRVTVIGPGARAGWEEDLSPERKQELQTLIVTSLLRDFMIPFIANGLVPIAGDKIDNFLDAESGNVVVTTLLTTLGQSAPQIYEKAYKGDMQGAMVELWLAAANDGVIRLALFDALSAIMYSQGGFSEQMEFASGAEALLKAAGAVDLILTWLDTSAQFHDFMNSARAQKFSVTVTPSVVHLDPASIEINIGESVNFTARVPDAADAGVVALEYRWSTPGAHGVLRDDRGHEGTQFASSSNRVVYDANRSSPGREVVTVEVFEIVPGREPRRIGTPKSATVRIDPYRVGFDPSQADVEGGESARFEVEIEPSYQGSGLFFRYTTSGRFGSIFPAPGTLSGFNAVTYHASAGVEGTDVIRVEVLDEAGASIGTAFAEVTIERDDEVFVSGSWKVETRPIGPNTICVGAYMLVPKVADAVRYDVHAHGFNDPFFYGTEHRTSFSGPSSSIKDLGDEYEIDLSGVCGGSSGEAEWTAYLTGRFQGIVVDVTVTVQ